VQRTFGKQYLSISTPLLGVAQTLIMNSYGDSAWQAQQRDLSVFSPNVCMTGLGKVVKGSALLTSPSPISPISLLRIVMDFHLSCSLAHPEKLEPMN
jgi:hypothetical protein